MQATNFECGENKLPYLSYPGEPIPLWIMHCRRCHYTCHPRLPEAPKRCRNKEGYADSDGVFHQACTTEKWNKWPEDFNPATGQCKHCIILWNMEQQGLLAAQPLSIKS
jgi:hypothetical protein